MNENTAPLRQLMTSATLDDPRRSVDYAPSMSSIAASTSSPSTESARLDSLLSLSTATSSSTHHQRASRRSLGLLGKIPRDFPSLLRRNSAILQTDLLLADYERDHAITTKDMYARSKDDDRTARKQKPENRLYNFLTRSRSRSRSKMDPTIPELAHDYHSRQSTADDKMHSTKPTVIVHSRPLSTTTTATNTTIMPPTPKARRTIAPQPEHNENTSRPSTPKAPSNTRKKLHNIFGIPLANPRNSSSRKSSISSTRPSTPDPHIASAAPPLPDAPGQVSRHNSLRRLNTPAPLDLERSESPSIRSQQPTFDLLESSTCTSGSTSSKRDHQYKSQKLFLARVPISSDDRHTAAPLIVSGPTRHRRSHTTHSDSLPSTPLSPSAPIHRNTQASQPHHADCNTATSPIPRIMHTPATPQRHETAPPRRQRKNSLDSSRRQMSVVDEERSTMDLDLDKAKRHDSRQGHHSVITKMRSNVRSTRHGSFDFERPGWGTTGIARSASGNSSTNAKTGSREHISESLKGRMREIPGSEILTRKSSQRTTPSPVAPLEPDHTGASTSTTHSKSTNGISSSLGRSTGKRAIGSGVAKLVGIPHGPFSFEPPVPSPTSTHGSAMSDHEKEMEERETVERRRRQRHERMRDQAAEENRQRNDIRDFNPMPPSSSSTGFRSASKGRSLDLGLGLAWAPSTVREKAIIPSSMFPLDKRSLSASSRTAMHRNFIDVQEEEDNEEAELAKLGKGIAEKFKNALDADGYHTFKKYVHRFDAHEIPIDGPNGIISRARRLLDKSSNLTHDQKNRLTDNLFKIILQNA